MLIGRYTVELKGWNNLLNLDVANNPSGVVIGLTVSRG